MYKPYNNYQIKKKFSGGGGRMAMGHRTNGSTQDF
jgi:hypothetical protein